MKILFIGDIVGKPGRLALRTNLPLLKQSYHPDLIIANAENASGGLGLVYKNYLELKELGIDIFTSGNHIWTKKETEDWIDGAEDLLRPANFPNAPGRGWTIIQRNNSKIAVINLQGRIFMEPLDCPFHTLDFILAQIPPDVKIRIVDFHAEATSEKQALAYYADGRVSALLGTHTHVQTADARVLPGGTAFISDVGMTGPRDSIIGMDTESIIKRFLTMRPTRFKVPNTPKIISFVLVDIDENTGHAKSIENVLKEVE